MSTSAGGVPDRAAALRAGYDTLLSNAFNPGKWITVQEKRSTSLAAVCGEYERSKAVQGTWFSEDTHFFDLSISGRPTSSCGTFVGSPVGSARLGRILFAPAGYRYDGGGGPGKQHSLFVFLNAQTLFPDEGHLLQMRELQIERCLNLQCDAIERTLVRIAAEIEAPDFASELLLEGLGITLNAETARLMERMRHQEAVKGGLPPRRLKMIEDRVRFGGGMPSIADLAELCGISRRQLMRAFKEETGRTLGSFVQQVTLERAKDMLLTDRHSVSAIAETVGFSSAAAFSTAFRRKTGKSPREFRYSRRSSAALSEIKGH